MTEDLRKAAQEATAGPWRHDRADDPRAAYEVCAHDGSDWEILVASCGRSGQANAAYIAALSPERVIGLLDAAEAWEWLTEQIGLELDYDWPRDCEPGEWRVHRVTGNINDREWELLGVGATPLEAVMAARSALSESKIP